MTPSALVLGAGGFLGSHTTRALLAAGWDVTGVVRDCDDPGVAWHLGSAMADVRLVEGDAGDAALLERLAPECDAIFPFAGRSGAASSMHHVVEDLTANVAAQVTVLETLRRSESPARVVFPGSRLQYGRAQYLPVDEDHPLEPTSAYGLSKSVAERYHRFYHDVYGVRTTCLRISLPYGPHQARADAAFGIVGTFTAAAARDEDLTVYGGGLQLRDFVFIDDLVELLLLAASHPRAIGGIYNAGGPQAVSLREMAQAVVATAGSGRVVDVEWPPDAAAVETGDFVLCLDKVTSDLGWAPQTDLEEGLARVWETAPA